MKKSVLAILFMILLGGFVARLYCFSNPIADWHSWRQADTSAVSRNFVTGGFDVLHPIYYDISNVQSGLDNPQGYRFVEFPLYNIFQAGFYKLFGVLTLEEWGRIVTIFASLITAVFLYLLVTKHSNTAAGLFTAFFYMFIPYNIYYGRVILPDPLMIVAIVGAIYFFDIALARPKNIGVWSLIISSVLAAAAMLIKPYAAFYLPVFLYIIWNRYQWRGFTRWYLWIYAIVVILPFGLWRVWMMQYPEGIPASSWLLNGNGIMFRPAFFRWIFYERITKLISGYIGILLLSLGIIIAWKGKSKFFYVAFLVSILLYLFIFATGNVQHDYYQIVIMPVIAIFYGLGASFLYSWKRNLMRIPLGKFILVFLTLGTFFLGWNIVKDYFNINNPSIIIAGEAVDRLTPKDAKIIALYDGDTSFLYQTKRKGWPSLEKDVPSLVAMGASYLVIANPRGQDLYFAKYYKIANKTPQYILYDLKAKL